MGLNISAYGRLEKLRDEDVELGNYNIPIDRKVVDFFDNPKFPYHISGIDSGSFYRNKGEQYSFRAGSYSGYNDWRNWLAQVAGFKDANEIWSRKPLAPFVELINFSDCEGAIGYIIAGKLAKDFKDYEQKAKEMKGLLPFALERYYDWKKACEIAAKKGAISFH